MSWDPAQYLKFAQPRLRPALELLARVHLTAPALIYDLGCGTGALAHIIAERWPEASVVGVDGSGEMLRSAAATLRAPNLRWSEQDIAGWRPASPPDLIYSNAALHWVPDHERLLPALIADLAPSGVLAVQMPRNFDAPTHRLIGETVCAGPWRAQLEPLLREAPVAEPRWYFERLSPLCADLDLWETEYFHILRGEHPVHEWIKGTWLRPLLAALPAADRGAFEQQCALRLEGAYPRRADGSTVLPFRRLFFIARRAA
jgi:trans-aconitate 2-methyltransferase